MASAIDSTVREFLDGLASKEPTPGGGSAAALAGALGAGLVSMVCQFTVGREKYADVDADMRRVLERCEALRSELQQAVDADIAAYGSYGRASSMPKESDDERAERHTALQAALRESTEVPMRVAACCAEVQELALEAAEKGNPYLISDAAVGAELAAAAGIAAELNVRLNAAGLEDTEYAQACIDAAEAAQERRREGALAERTMNVVLE
nr:cyclodeaminase/cyclohydrolase family protein [Actinomycetota bacterium]